MMSGRDNTSYPIHHIHQGKSNSWAALCKVTADQGSMNMNTPEKFWYCLAEGDNFYRQ